MEYFGITDNQQTMGLLIKTSVLKNISDNVQKRILKINIDQVGGLKNNV